MAPSKTVPPNLNWFGVAVPICLAGVSAHLRLPPKKNSKRVEIAGEGVPLPAREPCGTVLVALTGNSICEGSRDSAIRVSPLAYIEHTLIPFGTVFCLVTLDS